VGQVRRRFVHQDSDHYFYERWRGGGGGKPGVTVTTPAANSTSVPGELRGDSDHELRQRRGFDGIYVNNKLVYVVNAASLNKSLSLANGAEHTVVEEWDKCGGLHTRRSISLLALLRRRSSDGDYGDAERSERCGGSTEQFTATATYSDSSTANVTSTATWAVANTGVATITSGGVATGRLWVPRR